MALYPSGNPAPSNSANPFSSIITSSMKQLFTDAIDSLLADDGLTVPCKFIFGGQKRVACTNCQGGIYRPGGVIYFPPGKICPVCSNKPYINVTSSETNYMMVIFDSRKWRVLGRSISCPAANTANSQNMFAETMTRIELYPKIKAVQHVILDYTNKNFTHNKYQRLGEPEPLGLGTMQYIITAWERIG